MTLLCPNVLLKFYESSVHSCLRYSMGRYLAPKTNERICLIVNNSAARFLDYLGIWQDGTSYDRGD